MVLWKMKEKASSTAGVAEGKEEQLATGAPLFAIGCTGRLIGDPGNAGQGNGSETPDAVSQQLHAWCRDRVHRSCAVVHEQGLGGLGWGGGRMEGISPGPRVGIYGPHVLKRRCRSCR